MNKLYRDIAMGEVVATVDGNTFEVAGGNGMKMVNMGSKVFAYPVDPVSLKRISEELSEISVEIDLEETRLFQSELAKRIASA